MSEKAIIIDVDATLVAETPYDHTQTYDQCYNDMWHNATLTAQPLELGITMVKLLATMGYALIIMTARDETGRAQLTTKLATLGILPLFDDVLMRSPTDNGVPSAEVKAHMIESLAHEYTFVAAMDDGNHDMYRAHGIQVIDANAWNGAR